MLNADKFDRVGGLWPECSSTNITLVLKLLIDHLINKRIVVSSISSMLPRDMVVLAKNNLLLFSADFWIMKRKIEKKCDSAKKTLSILIGKM